MNYLLDLILIIGIMLCIIFSMKKGFISVSKGLVSIILTVVLMSSMQPFLLGLIENSVLSDRIREKVSGSIESMYERENFSKDTKTSDVDTADKICESLGFPEFMEKSIKSTVYGLYDAKKNVLDVITETVTLMILKVLSLLLVFLIVRLLVFLLVKTLALIFELPGLKTINKTLGAILGIVNAILIVYIVCAAVSLFIPAESRVVIDEAVKKTYILRHFYENNVLMLLFA